MRTSLASLTIVLMVSAVIAEKFGPEKVQVGKRKCTCSFDFTVSGGVAKGRGGCDKKCSGSVSSMSLEGEEYVFTFGMSVKKGKVAIKGAMAEPIEGSGSGPGGLGGPGSGSGGPGGPGSGSGGPGGNGGGPTGGNGGGNGGGAMSSGNCANGFVLVCPEVGGSCQEGAQQICPLEMPAGRMMPPAPPGEQDEDCMCLPLVLMQLVMARPEVMPMMRSLQDSEGLDRKAGDGDKFPTQAVQVGKKTCKCSFAFVVDGKKVKASGSCDKKCSGAVKTMELEGENFSYIFGMSVKKGKVAIKGAKATALGGGEATTTGRPPIGGGGSGSGRPPIGGGGSGSGMPGGGMGSGCVCVMAPGGDVGHTMPTMPTPVTMPTGGSGSGSGETPITMPTGETLVSLPTIATTGAPGGNGTGGGVPCPQVLCCGSDGVTYPTPCNLPAGVTCVSNTECPAAGPMEPKEIPWSYGMNPADVCVTPGTNVTFQWSSGHNVVSGLTAENFSSCSGLTDTSATAGPWTWMAPTTTNTYYFACGVGDGFHCSNGGMKAAVNVQEACPGL